MTEDEQQDEVRQAESPEEHLLSYALAIICNVSGGDWLKQSDEWRAAAEKWQAGYYALGKERVTLSSMIEVWNRVHVKDTGELGFGDLIEAIEQAGITVENDCATEQPSVPQ